MSKNINFDSNHKKAKNVAQAIGRVWDNVTPYFIITAVIADLAIGSFFLIESYDESLKNGDFDSKDDKAIVMEIDGETVAIPLHSYKQRINGGIKIVDTEGNTYVVPKNSNSTLFLGENAYEKASEMVNEQSYGSRHL